MRRVHEYIKKITNSSVATKTALKLLFNPEDYPGLRVIYDKNIILQIWKNDSLGDFCTWTLYLEGTTYVLRSVIWKQRFEYKLIKPITYAADTIICSPLSEELINLVQKTMSIQGAEIDNILMIDGIHWGINYFIQCGDMKSIQIQEATYMEQIQYIINRII